MQVAPPAASAVPVYPTASAGPTLSQAPQAPDDDAGTSTPTPAPASPAIAPPVAIEPAIVPYPPGAKGESSVLCELLVDGNGEVVQVRLLEGVEPFASAVGDAVRSFRFMPARRGDNAVAARIRMRIDFREPAAVPPAPAPPSHSPNPPFGNDRPAPALALGSTAIEDVTVVGARTEPGQTSLSATEIRQMPGAFGDAFRALEALPGVSPILSGLPFFFVRGAPPGNVGYFLDGVRVPLLYHVGIGPSVIHPALVDRVDFFPGGYPAQYGRFVGGILSGETVAPATRPHGEGNIRLFDTGALVETPFADGRGTLLLAGRYSYTAALLSLIVPNTRLAYWDYQARASWKLTSRDTISVFAFGSYDDLRLRDNPNDTFKDIFNTQFHRIDLRYDRTLNDGKLRIAATLGADATLVTNDFSTDGRNAHTLRSKLGGARIAYEKTLVDWAKVRLGADAYVEAFALDVRAALPPSQRSDFPGDATQASDGSTSTSNSSSNLTLSSLFPARTEFTAGIRGDVVLKLSSRVTMTPGVRLDLFRSHVAGATTSSTAPANAFVPSVDPRLAGRVTLTPTLAWIMTFGISHQPPSFFLPVPGFQPGTLGNGLQTSVQFAQGFDTQLPWKLSLTGTAYVQNFLNLTDLTATCDPTNLDVSGAAAQCASKSVRGRSIGAEFLLRRQITERLTGFVSYTLSRSTRYAQPPRFTALFGSLPITTILSEFDRTHVLTVIASYDLGRHWRAGGRVFAYSGRPYSTTIDGYPIPPYNTERTPPFYRVDMRLEKMWALGPYARVSLVVEGLNIFLQKEDASVACTPQTSSGLTPILQKQPDTCSFVAVGPVSVPSVGVEGVF